MDVSQVLLLSNGITSQEIKRGEINRATAKTGEHYRVLEKTVDKDQLLDDVLAKKEGQDLHLVYSDGTEVILEDYYTVCADGACDVTLPGETASGYQIGTNDVTGIAASQESTLVYAHGHRDTLIGMTQDTPMQATLSNLESAQITYLPEQATGLSMGSWGGLALLGGLGIAAASGNASLADTQAVVLDTTAPIFQSAASSADGTKVIMTYDGALNATTAAVGDFAVMIGGVANTVTAVSVGGSAVELTLTTTVANGDTVTVAYTDPSVGDDANAIQDAAGNDAITITAQAVTNNLPGPDTSIVVFDLVNGVSSDHSSRTFDVGESYTIYLVVDADSHVMNTVPTTGNATWGMWDAGESLGADDKVVLVSGDGSDVLGTSGGVVVGSVGHAGWVQWQGPGGELAVTFGYRLGMMTRRNDSRVSYSAMMWSDSDAPSVAVSLMHDYGPVIPAGVLTSQGLV
jgi:uncharacterized repeat protein (TIGR02059 family)